MYAICQRNAERLKVGDAFGIDKRYPSTTTCWPIRRSISSTSTRPIPDHAWMSIAALKAGKHVMCTVPMATTIEECEQICRARRRPA